MEKYNNEKEFLENYDVTKFDRLSMTSDILLVSVSSQVSIDYRKTDKKIISILLVKRNEFPFKDKWCLPGGFLNPKNETLDECAKRVLKNETNLSNIYLEQLYTFDDIKRDPRTRVVSTSYVALVDKNKLTHKLSKNAFWFDITEFKEVDNIVNVTLNNGKEIISFSIKKSLVEKTTNQYSFSIIKNESIAFDHPKVILAGIERIRNKINYTDIVFNMMPKYFTLGELQDVYEVILGEKLLAPAFRRIIANKVEKTDKMLTGKGHRPSALFKYKENPFEYDEKTDKKTTKKIKVKPHEEDVLGFCKDAKTLKEITSYFGFNDIATFKKNYINPLLEKGTLQLTIPDQPKNRNQKYIAR